ncbi:fumarate reductase subunit FrdD [Billgrantia kenyensis]|uniref:Fumarate reductase subunit D n=1 Tax=Billgrantia kenyensis TaxID=321266 RepID=A0A7V9W053_9GAMM|nr:fumarate reductase subunit FrdD [Halomonas kenyensis]MBA2778591.1 fumarate reductase subunit D [Halomonas kenyensis]MCG6661604.1 fumarate reductase subunit D [Halomonas kenyensis]
MSDKPSRRQAFDEPLWWGLFSAGGVCFAVFVPAAILCLALLAPLGVVPLDAERARSMLFSLPGLLFVGAVICLPLFHAAHRIRHGCFDLRLGHDGVNKWLTYGSAASLSAAALTGVLIGMLM